MLAYNRFIICIRGNPIIVESLPVLATAGGRTVLAGASHAVGMALGEVHQKELRLIV